MVIIMDKRLLDYHLKLLDEMDEQYDESVGMLGTDIDKPNGYHSRIKKGRVHSISTNSEYAVALLDGGRAEDIKRAETVIRNVLRLQDLNPEHPDTYGLWAYHMEEPLEQMAPPDWNMADFNGMSLVQVLLYYRDIIDAELVKDIERACIAACKCIIKRNVPMSYTNIAFMGTYVTYVVGELLDDEILEYAKKRLLRLYNHVVYTGYIDEYNSPTYSVLLVNIIGLMMQHIRDANAQEMISELNDRAWRMIAEHFHKATGEWAGPQLRAYTDFVKPNMLSFFELALNFEVKLTDEKVYVITDMHNGVKCPEKYKSCFTADTGDRMIRRLLTPGFQYPYFFQARAEMSWLSDRYTLGIFSVSEFWNQHRMFLSYIGDKNNKYCLRLRVLHDFYDYSSGLFKGAQEKNAVLGQIMFSNDRGDTHCNIDRLKDGKLTARDLRIRFQLEGDIDSVKTNRQGNSLKFNAAGVDAEVGYSFCEFSEGEPSVELSRDGNLLCFDMVLYSGDEKQFCFYDIERAVAAVYAKVGSVAESLPQSGLKDGRLISTWNQNGVQMRLECPERPSDFASLILKSSQYIDGMSIEQLCADYPLPGC